LLDRPSSSQRPRIEMGNANALKLGLFGVNCSSGRAATRVPERWSASWPDCLALAKMADACGIDFMLPIGRWKGYGGETDLHGETLETITWATGLLAATQNVTVFGTVHAPLFHPIIAAKQCVTADHVGHGRFGLNIVAGWNEGEFEMFGVQQREHEQRYAYAQEWISAIKQAWGPEEDFYFNGEHIKLAKVRAKPKPYGGTRPLIMNAGSTPTGQAFALRNTDAYFTATSESRKGGVDIIKKMVADIKAAAATHGREIEVFTVGQVVCRPTQKEAEDYYHYAVIEMADWGSVDSMLRIKNITPETVGAEEYQKKREYFASRAIGGYPFVGSPDHIAEQLAALSEGGIRGIAFSMINWLEELPLFRDEVLPRLERKGVRAKRH
jgi:alkanesulfonate monooxygenase SsuD/methylene tetrahydromethanopterin reductase-like flavin-dependent oxidoreductase (luciferase family)